MMPDEQILYDEERKRRVKILRFADGSFSFIEEHYSDEPLELCCIPQNERRSRPICASFEVAVREAKGRVEWLAAMDGALDRQR